MSGAKLAPPLSRTDKCVADAELRALSSEENDNFGASLQCDYKHERECSSAVS